MEETKLQKLYWDSVSINNKLFIIEKELKRRKKQGRAIAKKLDEFINLSNSLVALKKEMKMLEK